MYPPTQWNLRVADEAVLNEVLENPKIIPLKKGLEQTLRKLDAPDW
jgi:hypothetical protein